MQSIHLHLRKRLTQVLMNHLLMDIQYRSLIQLKTQLVVMQTLVYNTDMFGEMDKQLQLM